MRTSELGAYAWINVVGPGRSRVKSQRVPGKAPRSNDDAEDWRVEPCRKCKTLAMLWWRYCPFCSTQLPTVLDGQAVKHAAPDGARWVRWEWEGREAPVAEAVALSALRKAHRLYVRSCGSRFRDVPFRARVVPGGVYDPTTDTVKQFP